MRTGLLSGLENYKSDILIVAGGGGGGAYDGVGGSGGGIEGGYGNVSTTVVGTQTSGNAFGVGGNGLPDTGGSGGGGGGYWGGNADVNDSATSAGGGSGYIGNSLLLSYGDVNKIMYCYNCTLSSEDDTRTVSTTNVSSIAVTEYAKRESGYARISYIDNNFYKTFEFTNSVQKFIAFANGYYQVELWGAQGGNNSRATTIGGYGGYTKGIIELTKGEELYIYVGEAGTEGQTDCKQFERLLPTSVCRENVGEKTGSAA